MAQELGRGRYIDVVKRQERAGCGEGPNREGGNKQ